MRPPSPDCNIYIQASVLIGLWDDNYSRVCCAVFDVRTGSRRCVERIQKGKKRETRRIGKKKAKKRVAKVDKVHRIRPDDGARKCVNARKENASDSWRGIIYIYIYGKGYIYKYK